MVRIRCVYISSISLGASSSSSSNQGLTLAHFRAQLEDIRDTSLSSELNLSTCGTHSRVTLGCMGDKVSLS